MNIKASFSCVPIKFGTVWPWLGEMIMFLEAPADAQAGLR